VATTSTGSSSRSSRARPPPDVPERAGDVAAALEALGLRPSRRAGQSFLVDPIAADTLAALVTPTGGRPVVEIGGGLGAVTRALLRRGIVTPTVVERDPRLAAFLASTFGDRIRLVVGDALEVELPPEPIVVGSLPYSAATPILLRLFERRTPRVVAVVQAEVAGRLVAPEGSRAYGRLSILAALYGAAEGFRELPPSSFFPRPDVTSRIVVHTARTGPLPVRDVPRLEGVVRTLFSSRRKQLGNLLPRLVPGAAAQELVARGAGWPSGWRRLRPEALPPEAFFRLAELLPDRASGTPAPSP
jgi:16S rRNA (adenine1518-N6/adenine1519-N6)-dimethyltransferase